MICLISDTYKKAEKWAKTQNLELDEWFYVSDESDIKSRKDFHVIVVGDMEGIPPAYFEKIYELALRRGRMK